MAEKLKIIPLGGLNEIGKNMTVLEYGKDMIVVDCGLGFPEDDMYGVDLVIPDVTYLAKNQKKLRGFFITHGHEDHIGRRLVLGFRERGTRPLALCGTMGPEWNDLGLSYTCELAADAAELDGDGALHRLPLHGRPACLRLTGSGAKLETLLRSRAAQERLLLETAALCRAHGTAQVELTVRDLLPDCDPAPLVSRLQTLLAERGGGLTLALPRPGALGWEAPMLARLAAAAGRVRAAPGLPGLPPEKLLADYDDAACDRCGLRTERLSRGEALALARRTGACLHYDAAKHLTCFSYRDETGAPHTVRFAGLRSWMERLRALEQAGVAALALRAPDPALCLLLHTQFKLG